MGDRLVLRCRPVKDETTDISISITELGTMMLGCQHTNHIESGKFESNHYHKDTATWFGLGFQNFGL